MRRCLYDPVTGYYRRRDRNPFGRAGDFYTAVQLSPVFGQVLSLYLERHAPQDVIDLGAGRGGLREPLSQWSYRAIDWDFDPLPERIRGVVIANEFFDALPVRLLQNFGGGEWRELLVEDGQRLVRSEELDPALEEYVRMYGGAILAGGLLEVNLEMADWIRRLSKALSGKARTTGPEGSAPAKEWRRATGPCALLGNARTTGPASLESRITPQPGYALGAPPKEQADSLVEWRRAAGPCGLLGNARTRGPEGSAPPEEWRRATGPCALDAGRLLVIDYGYDARELPRFPNGTLMSYRRHVAGSDVLAQPGTRDITAHVNFSEMKRLACEAGLSLVKECSLAAWVLDVFGPAELQRHWDSEGERWRLLWKQLVFGLGETFRVLEFERACK